MLQRVIGKQIQLQEKGGQQNCVPSKSLTYGLREWNKALSGISKKKANWGKT